MNQARMTWKIPFSLAVLWFAFGILYQVRQNLGLLVVVICVVVLGSLAAKWAYGWLQATHERQVARMEELQIPRIRLVDALLNLSPQDVALLTARTTQKLAEDLTSPGPAMPANRLAGQREWLRAVRQYVDHNSDNLKFWPDPAAPDSLKQTVDETDSIIGELQQHTSSIPQGDAKLYAGKLEVQSSAFEQLAGAA